MKTTTYRRRSTKHLVAALIRRHPMTLVWIAGAIFTLISHTM